MANSFYKDAQKVFDNDKKYVEIPKGATNGDIIKALFGGMELNESGDMVYIEKLYFGFPRGWWDAPYRKEVEE